MNHVLIVAAYLFTTVAIAWGIIEPIVIPNWSIAVGHYVSVIPPTDPIVAKSVLQDVKSIPEAKAAPDGVVLYTINATTEAKLVLTEIILSDVESTPELKTTVTDTVIHDVDITPEAKMTTAEITMSTVGVASELRMVVSEVVLREVMSIEFATNAYGSGVGDAEITHEIFVAWVFDGISSKYHNLSPYTPLGARKVQFRERFESMGDGWRHDVEFLQEFEDFANMVNNALLRRAAYNNRKRPKKRSKL